MLSFPQESVPGLCPWQEGALHSAEACSKLWTVEGWGRTVGTQKATRREGGWPSTSRAPLTPHLPQFSEPQNLLSF